MNLHVGTNDILCHPACIGVDDGTAPARHDIDGMSSYGAWGCRKRVESNGLNIAVQPVDCRKVDMIRIMREVGNGVEVIDARLRVRDGFEHKGIMTAATRQGIATG